MPGQCAAGDAPSQAALVEAEEAALDFANAWWDPLHADEQCLRGPIFAMVDLHQQSGCRENEESRGNKHDGTNNKERQRYCA